MQKLSCQFSCGGESNTVHKDVELAITLFELCKRAGDFFILGDVAHEALSSGKRIDQIFGFLGEALVLVRQGQVHAGGVQALRDRPGNRSFVGNAKDDGVPAFEVVGHVGLLDEVELERITASSCELRIVSYPLRAMSYELFADPS